MMFKLRGERRSMSGSNSCLMVGNIRHRRFTPISHALNYQLFMPCIDLDEIVHLERSVFCFGRNWWHWARFRREDYVGTGDIKQAVFQKVNELGGHCLSGSVRAVVHLRYFGIYFSPVNFYYVYDDAGQWQYLLAEVSNTPWNERHYYLLDATDKSSWQHDKAFHVSPFNEACVLSVDGFGDFTNQLYVDIMRLYDESILDITQCAA